jgi:hypothetical protein
MTATDRIVEDREICEYLSEMDYLANRDALDEAMAWDQPRSA